MRIIFLLDNNLQINIIVFWLISLIKLIKTPSLILNKLTLFYLRLAARTY
jgi:hypothetical protein